jgi:hypothetical protein
MTREGSMPAQKPEVVDEPRETARVMMAMPVSPIEYERDLQFRERAARRRDPNARLNAQATLDAAPRVTVILNPTEADRKYGESHVDSDGYPVYPDWTCTYNGLSLAYRVGVQIEMPSYIYEIYAHNQRLPVFRKAPGEPGEVFSREIPEHGGLYQPPGFGR